MLFRGVDSFVSTLIPFVREGIEAGEGVFAAAATDNLDALRSELGTVPSGVDLVEAVDWYVKPAQTLGMYLSFVNEQLGGGRPGVRIIGEVLWPERGSELRREWIRYESALNAVFADLPVRLICPYDSGRLSPSTIAAARTTHPIVIEHGVTSASGPYSPPERLLRKLTERMPLPAHHDEDRFDPGDFVGPAAFVIDHARRAGLSRDRSLNVGAAAVEIVTSAAKPWKRPGARGRLDERSKSSSVRSKMTRRDPTRSRDSVRPPPKPRMGGTCGSRANSPICSRSASGRVEPPCG